MKTQTKTIIRTTVWITLLGPMLTPYWMIGALWLMVMDTKWWKEVWSENETQF